MQTNMNHGKAQKAQRKHNAPKSHKDRWNALLSWANKRKGYVIGGRELVRVMENMEQKG